MPITKTSCFVSASENLTGGIHAYEDGHRIAYVEFGQCLTVLGSDISACDLAEKLEAAAATLRRVELELDANAVAVPHNVAEVA